MTAYDQNSPEYQEQMNKAYAEHERKEQKRSFQEKRSFEEKEVSPKQKRLKGRLIIQYPLEGANWKPKFKFEAMKLGHSMTSLLMVWIENFLKAKEGK